MRKITQIRTWAAVAVLILVANGLASCSNSDGSEEMTAVQVAVPTDLRLSKHEFVEGETFEYVYENTEATYQTVSAQDGKVPRVTDLQKVVQVRTRVRFTIVADGDTLQKQLEFIDPVFREATAEELTNAAGLGPYQPLSAKIPGFPTTVSYTYDIGMDGYVALELYKVFGDHFHPFVYSYIDVFTFPTTVEGISENLLPGGWSTTPPIDVNFSGVQYHNSSPNLFYDRVDELDGMAQAYFKVQNPGNYVELIGLDSSFIQTFHVPLTGSVAGLMSTGELQETIFNKNGEGQPTATIRQVSMTMQTDRTRTAITGD
jgi:hypothetical protein